MSTQITGLGTFTLPLEKGKSEMLDFFAPQRRSSWLTPVISISSPSETFSDFSNNETCDLSFKIPFVSSIEFTKSKMIVFSEKAGILFWEMLPQHLLKDLRDTIEIFKFAGRLAMLPFMLRGRNRIIFCQTVGFYIYPSNEYGFCELFVSMAYKFAWVYF